MSDPVPPLCIGFVSTRIAGTDGVSLEIRKWAEVLERAGHRCVYFAGEHDRPAERCALVERAHFKHPEVAALQADLFGRRTRTRSASDRVQELKDHLKEQLYRFRERFRVDLLIPENVLAIPMHVPLGLAVTEFLAETGLPALAHHHDFAWERDRFLVNGCQDYLSRAFPPDLPSLEHAVINSLAAYQLSHRRGLSNTVVPNVLDFAAEPESSAARRAAVREALGFGPDDTLVLQPTRVVPRKWIERSVEVVARLGLRRPRLVISHDSGDEGDAYRRRVAEYAATLGVTLVPVADRIAVDGSPGPDGAPRFRIGDVYQAADLVTYPSGYEGFGNAFLEAVYYRVPIVVNRYSIYIADIEPHGFDVIAIEGFAAETAIDAARAVLADPERRRAMVERNYQLARRAFSYEVLEQKLGSLLRRCLERRV